MDWIKKKKKEQLACFSVGLCNPYLSFWFSVFIILPALYCAEFFSSCSSSILPLYQCLKINLNVLYIVARDLEDDTSVAISCIKMACQSGLPGAVVVLVKIMVNKCLVVWSQELEGPWELTCGAAAQDW